MAPVRATRALPELSPEHKNGIATCRVIGIGLVAGGVSLGVSITYAAGRLL